MGSSILFRNDKLGFTVQGKGSVVVLIHGFLGSGQIWKDTAVNLARSYRVISIDLPGHGDSACFGYVHSMELMARAVKAVLNHLHLRKYVLIGHSMGGYVALAFADLFPDSIKGLCLFHSTAYPDGDEKKRDRERAISLVKANRRVYTTGTIRNLFAPSNLKYMKKELAFATEIAARTSRQGIVAALIGMKDRPGRDLILGLVNYPVMMVIGAHDNMLPKEQLFGQSRILRKPAILYLEHDGHFGFLESPIRSNKELRKFLRKCYRP